MCANLREKDRQNYQKSVRFRQPVIPGLTRDPLTFAELWGGIPGQARNDEVLCFVKLT